MLVLCVYPETERHGAPSACACIRGPLMLNGFRWRTQYMPRTWSFTRHTSPLVFSRHYPKKPSQGSLQKPRMDLEHWHVLKPLRSVALGHGMEVSPHTEPFVSLLFMFKHRSLRAPCCCSSLLSPRFLRFGDRSQALPCLCSHWSSVLLAFTPWLELSA